MSSISIHNPAVSTETAENKVSVRTAGILAGTGYIILFILAIFANFMVKEGLIVTGNAAATAANISGSEGLFRAGMLSFLVVFLLDVPIAWALLVLFRGINRDLSLLAAWFRIIYTVFMGAALVFFFQGLQYLKGGASLAVFSSIQLESLALVSLDTFNSAWLIGLTAFGVHLVLVGALILRSGNITKILGIVLIIAGAAYVLDTFAHTIMANYQNFSAVFTAIVAVPSIVAEGWFGIWLLVKGGKNIPAEQKAQGAA